MSEILKKNLKFLRERTAETEGIKYLSCQKFVELLNLDEIGLAGNTWNNYEERGSVPKLETLVYISEKFNILLDDLVKKDLTETKVVKNKNMDGYLVRVVDKKASAGFGVGFSDPTYLEGLTSMSVPFWIPSLSLAFEISGDSMFPYVDDGDFIIASPLDSFDLVKDGHNYIVIAPDDIYFKMIYQNSESLSLVSKNAKYKPLELLKDDTIQLWKVEGELMRSRVRIRE